jgi:hypothetical protein
MTLFLFVLAAGAAATSEVMLRQANPDVRLSLWRGRPPRYPAAARVLAGLAGGSAVLGAISLDEHVARWWGVIPIFVVFLPAIFLRLLSNGRVPRQSAH